MISSSVTLLSADVAEEAKSKSRPVMIKDAGLRAENTTIRQGFASCGDFSRRFRSFERERPESSEFCTERYCVQISVYSERIQFGRLLSVRNHDVSKPSVIINVNVILVWNWYRDYTAPSSASVIFRAAILSPRGDFCLVTLTSKQRHFGVSESTRQLWGVNSSFTL